MREIRFDGGMRGTKGIGGGLNQLFNNFKTKNTPNSVVSDGLKQFNNNTYSQIQQEFVLTLPKTMQQKFADAVSNYQSVPYETRVATGGMKERFNPSDADYDEMKHLDMKKDTQEV